MNEAWNGLVISFSAAISAPTITGSAWVAIPAYLVGAASFVALLGISWWEEDEEWTDRSR